MAAVAWTHQEETESRVESWVTTLGGIQLTVTAVDGGWAWTDNTSGLSRHHGVVLSEDLDEALRSAMREAFSSLRN